MQRYKSDIRHINAEPNSWGEAETSLCYSIGLKLKHFCEIVGKNGFNWLLRNCCLSVVYGAVIFWCVDGNAIDQRGLNVSRWTTTAFSGEVAARRPQSVSPRNFQRQERVLRLTVSLFLI